MQWKEVEFTTDLPMVLHTMQEHGLLLTSVDPRGKPNTMTIGWGTPGVIWGRPIFSVLVRPSRFTFDNIEATGRFVVSVPTAEMHEVCMHCGTASGRDEDKLAACRLTTAPGQAVDVPLIEQCIMHYECRVVHRNDVIDSQLDAAVRSDCYGAGNLHRVYYGQILRVARRS
jgi:flavin reductase (DIM6/NTAB) family NADH-FMN oxidoreductase RutF